MEILYRLAQMESEAGKHDPAMQKFKEVASEGNKLWIATQARERCEAFSGEQRHASEP